LIQPILLATLYALYDRLLRCRANL